MEIVVEGKTTEEAIEAACRQLGQPRDRVEIQVITPGSTGIFGLVGARKAKVRARLKGGAPQAAPEEAQAEAAPAEAARGEAARPPEERRRHARGGRRRHRGPRRTAAEAAAGPLAEPLAEAEAEGVAEAAGPEPAVAEPAALAAAPEAVPAEPEPEPEPELPPASPELVEAAREACEQIVAALGFEAVEVQATALPGEARLELVGEEAPELIGHKGDVLNALQHLVSKIANRRANTRTTVTLDTAGWREERRQGLEEMALKMARKAKESGKPVALSPMNAHDRRIVHLALQGEADLKTKSTGEGALRKVILFPRRRRRNSRRGRGGEPPRES